MGPVVTLVAAVVAAVVALTVAVLDRRWIARDERERWERADKRQVYARFLGGTSAAWSGHLLGGMDPDAVYGRLEQLVLRRAELELVATPQVRAAAAALFDAALNEKQISEAPQVFRGLEKTFIDACREDLGYRS